MAAEKNAIIVFSRGCLSSIRGGTGTCFGVPLGSMAMRYRFLVTLACASFLIFGRGSRADTNSARKRFKAAAPDLWWVLLIHETYAALAIDKDVVRNGS